jgi:DNA modification methylase
MSVTALVRHPAKFGDALIPVLAETIKDYVPLGGVVLDPFAGVGKIHLLPYHTVGVEIEPEWANQHSQTIVGDALKLPFPANTFDAVCTSPVFGNRMSDHHDAKDDSVRYSYKHTLGRDLHPNNSGQLQWGDAYRSFHRLAWAEVARVIKPKGVFVLNISDHIRSFCRMPVSAWHTNTIIRLGFDYLDRIPVETKRLRYGANRELRPVVEYVELFQWRL